MKKLKGDDAATKYYLSLSEKERVRWASSYMSFEDYMRAHIK